MSVTRDELRKAAQSISPRQFDRIALEYLEISQVGQCLFTCMAKYPTW